MVTAVGAEAGTIWFYNKRGDGNIYPSFSIGGADLTGMSLRSGEGIAGAVVETGNRRYITTPSMLACFLSVVICVIFALIINAIALRKINHGNPLTVWLSQDGEVSLRLLLRFDGYALW